MPSFRYKHGDRPLEGYTIQRGAGRGGFGEVYYAISDSGREVALKVVNDYAQIEMRGISQCMNLKSPHLVTIFDVRYDDEGTPFVIMEFVSGPTLRQLLDESPGGLGPQKAAFFLREIGKGLAHLHECGIVHRDLKPGNIFYENGYVKIGDYGLSKAITASQHSGQTITVGTVHYMAPEIGMGRYDKGIDIYAMGAMLYEMLTGTVPYLGASPAEIIMKHVTGEPNVAALEEPFATVVKKAMAKDPADRYQSVQEMVEAIFGAEHVQQSVSQFSPESLSMVAQRVAQRAAHRVAVGVGGGSSATPPPIPPGPHRGGQFSRRMGELGQRVGEFGERVGEWAGDMGARLGDRLSNMGGRPPLPAPAAAPLRAPLPAPLLLKGELGDITRDPLARGQRHLLVLLTSALVSIATAFFVMAGTRAYTQPMPISLLVFLAIFGTSHAIIVARYRLLPRVQSEATGVRRLMMGAIASVPLTILALILSTGSNTGSLAAALLGGIILLFLLNWTDSTAPARRERIAFRDIVIAGLFGALASFLLGGRIELGIGIMAGISLTTQILAPWDPCARKRSAPACGEQPAQAVPAAAGVPIGAAPAAAARAPAPSRRNPAFEHLEPPVTFVNPLAIQLNPTRRVPAAIRWLWLIASVLIITIGTLLLASVGFEDWRNDEPIVIGFGIGMLLFGFLAGYKSFQTRFHGIWTYLFKPLLLWACAQSILISGLILGYWNGHMPDEEFLIALFFIIFPSLLALVLLFVRIRREQAVPPPLPGAYSPSAPTMMMPPAAEQPAPEAPAAAPADAVAPGLLAAPEPSYGSQAELDSVSTSLPGAQSVVSGFLGFIGTILLLAALAAGLIVALELPEMVASGALDPRAAEDARRAFGFDRWPSLFKQVATIVMYAALFVSGAILLAARRPRGILHMLRIPPAIAAFLGSILLLDAALGGKWAVIADPSGNPSPPAAIEAYLSAARSAPAICAAILATIGIVLALWPAARGRREPLQ